MADEELKRRQSMTFRQAEGLEPLPQRLKLGELSKELRALIWSELFKSLESAKDEWDPGRLTEPWATIAYDYHVEVRHQPGDEWSPVRRYTVDLLKDVFMRASYDQFLDVLQYFLRHRECPYQLKIDLAEALKTANAAYFVHFDGNIPTIMPAATPEEAATVQKAFADLNASRYGGARKHLRRAGEELNAGNFADSVRESIHAVESVACVITGMEKATLGDALKKLASKHDVHPALKEAVSRLYGWTSDEKGVRHALHDEPAKVGIDEAQFMLGACASFVSYLLAKSRTT